MKIKNQMNILRRLGELNGNTGKYKLHHAGPKVNYEPTNERAFGVGYDNIEGAIHHEIDKLNRNGVAP